MTVTAVAVPMAKSLAPALAPVMREAANNLFSSRNARITAKNTRTLAAIGVVGHIATELIQAVPLVMSEYAGIRTERNRHEEAMQLHTRALEVIQVTAVILEAELTLLANTDDRAAVSAVLANYRRDLLLLAGIAAAADH